MTLQAVWYSVVLMSLLALTFTKSPRAEESSMFSSSGEEMAFSVAARARFSPFASPEPIIAMPRSPMTVRMSCRSVLITPSFWLMRAMS